MPMDNNDNQYPGLSEENSKITSVLHPYGLPKFDFDHNHIRFDSLAENEVFLGISSREENHWIEDFSRGNSVIEFASSAAECCSIPRHVNVWSEATSSESVEMLLKSVGQEDMLPGESIIESDACGELGTLAKQMEHNPRPVGTRNDQDSNVEVPIQRSDNSSRLIEGSEVADMDPKCSSLTQVEDSASGCSATLKSGSVVHAWNSQDKEICDDENQPKLGTFLNESLNYNMEETLVTQRCSDSSSHHVREDVEFSNGQDRSAKPLDNASNEPQQTNACRVNDASACSLSDVIHSSMSEFPGFVTPNAGATQNFEESSSISAKEESSLPIEGNRQDLHSVESCQIAEDLVLPGSLEIKHSTDVSEKSFGGSEGELRVDKQAASSGGVDIKCEQPKDFMSPTSHTESSVECKESCQGSHSQADKRVPTTTCEGNIPGTEPELGIHMIEDPVSHVDNLPILTDASQSTQSVTEHIDENQNRRNGATEKHEDTVLSSVSSGIIMSVEAAKSGKQDHPGDISSKPAILYNDAERLSTSSLDEEMKKEIVMEQTLDPDKPSTIKSESNAGSNDSKAASHESSHGTTDEIAEQNEELNLPSDVEPMHLDKIANTDADVILEEETISIKVPSQVESETGIVSLAERNLTFNIPAVEVIQDDSSLPSTCIDAAPLNEDIMVNPKETIGCSNTMDVVNVPCDSNVVVAEGAEAVAIGKNMETNIENSCLAGLSKTSEADKPTQDIASVISGNKLPAPDERMTANHMQSAAEHVSDRTSKAGEVPSVPRNDGTIEGSIKQRSFSFDVPPVSEKESGSTPSGSQKNLGGGEVLQVTNIVTEGGSVSIGAKTTSERKTRRGSAKSTKKNPKKGNNARQPEDNTACQLVSPSGPTRLLQFGVGVTESSCRKSTATPIPSSNLPDLNTSISTSALFHQPFTDLQQVQLRAQIFVYGSLIQGTVPDEPCMVSAFGTSDGGRTSWEPKWRACVERFHNQKTVSNSYGIPIQSRSGSKGQDKSSKQSARRSKVVPSPVNLFGNKETPSTSVKPMIPLSSPLWNLSTPLSDGLPPSNVVRGAPQALPPLHPCQTPPARTFGGQTTSWLSPAPISGPQVSSSRSSAFDLSTCFSSSPSAEMVKSTPLNDPPLDFSSSIKHDINAPIPSLVQDPSLQKLPIYPAIHKSRKRRKSSTAEESPQNSLSTTSVLPSFDALTSNSSKKGPVVARLSSISSHPTTPLIGGHFSTTVAVTASPAVAVDPIQRSELHMDKNFSNRDELKQVEEAKLSGEEAAAHAADLVSRCQSIWRALEDQRTSSLAPDRELQLSSSAAAIAAAASVAKAAAAAAKLASTAALHFHQVAIQVLHGNVIPAQEGETFVSDVANNLSNATPASILRSVNGNDAPNSIITAAREAARRRVEAALVASQHAENLDAIVKAAELAAEAVSQAGRVVSMGKPFPLSLLVEAGPENYWRGDLQLVKSSTEKGDMNDIGSSKEVCKQAEGPDLEVCTLVKGSSLPEDIARDMSKNIRVDEVISVSHISGEKSISGTKVGPSPDHTGGSLASDHADAESVPLQDTHGSDQQTLSDDCIKENCNVEVFKDGGCFKGAWYSAKVLSLNDDKALVCFTDLQSDKESDSLKEWIPLEGEGNNVPNIRIAHPISGVNFDKTRKRGRSALKVYQWSVGDRVDAWFKDCWREGVITEQKNNDSTSFSVHFPAHGETSVVKAWHLRPTLTWNNGKWVELLTSRQSALSQGDTPHGKRVRLANTVEMKGRGEIPKTMDNLQLENVNEPKLLPLSSTEKVFNIGSNRVDNKVAAPRMMRSGLQKEGLKFFGVPRPGKKRKFMEVGKQIVSEQSTKNDVPNDSSKLSKYLMPQGTGSRGFRNSSKVEVKENQFAESKLKAPNKLPGISSRTLSQRENSTSAASGHREINSRSHTVKGSISNNERGSLNLVKSGSGSNREAISDVPISAQSLPPDRNKKASTNINSERTMKGKLAIAGGRTEAAAEDKPPPDSTGTRRSNRKIQPTSRLLEGLQSSLISSKIPSASHDRSHRFQKSTFASRGGF